MRGLKPVDADNKRSQLGRIFYRCVDWNSFGKINFSIGLSRIFYRCVDWNMEGVQIIEEAYVASFTDAWIETMISVCQFTPSSRIFYRCVDWNSVPVWRNISIPSRIFYRCVDWNSSPSCGLSAGSSRIFYRCVDWNKIEKCKAVASSVASFTDAWIETDGTYVYNEGVNVASFTDAWIETGRQARPEGRGQSHLLQMRGLKQKMI